jgi:retinol dehydrogenase-12
MQAKLANVLFTNELAERYKEHGITSVSLHPGVVRTDIWRIFKQKIDVMSVIFFVFSPLFWLISKSCKDGAQTTIHCAIDDSVVSLNGQYFV